MEPIKEWHFHTYWFAKENHPSATEALRLHAALLDEIKSDPSFVVVCHGVTGDLVPGLEGRPPPLNHRPVGPHLSGSFETWVPQESLPRALSWFTQHRGSLSILVHPLTRYERADHSTHAMWLGTPWTIDLEFLREDVAIALLSTVFSLVEAKRKSTVSSMEEFWTFFAVIYGLVLLPVVGYFLYALARDPATPELARLMWQWFKRKTLGFLGPNHDPPVQHTTIRQHATSVASISRKQR